MVRGSSALISGSTSVVATGSDVDSIAVSIFGASSGTLVALPLSGDFERPRDLIVLVNRRLRLCFFCGGGWYSASSVGTGAVSEVVGAASVDLETSASPLVRAVDVALSLVSFFGRKLMKILERLPLSALVSVGAAGAASSACAGASAAGAGAVSAASVSARTGASVVSSAAAGSGETSLVAGFDFQKPAIDLRFSLSFFASGAGSNISTSH